MWKLSSLSFHLECLIYWCVFVLSSSLLNWDTYLLFSVLNGHQLPRETGVRWSRVYKAAAHHCTPTFLSTQAHAYTHTTHTTRTWRDSKSSPFTHISPLSYIAGPPRNALSMLAPSRHTPRSWP